MKSTPITIFHILDMEPGDFTYALIKPDGFESHRGHILGLIADAGLQIGASLVKQMTPYDVRILYYEHVGRFYYDRNAQFIMSGQSQGLILTGKGAQKIWRLKLMPEIRHLWGQNNDDPEKKHLNLVHGSDSPVAALREAALLMF